MTENKQSVVIIGGGIAGVQAATDLGNMGFKVYLVERTPSIGGRMAQLDKTFPTNDCSICILSPKLIAAARHPNIQLLVNSEVTSVSGEAGNFKVNVIKHPRYVDEEKCVGCGECAAKCPTKVPNEFDRELSIRKAIYVPFPQAVPLIYSIDRENCRYFQKGKCGVCAKICKAEAIDYEQEPEEITLEVGAIIIALGFEFYDMSTMPEYGYGKFENVVTAMEFERMICASGPTHGHLQRPSDDNEPKKIAFIQCAGSRDYKHLRYCTGVCCMHSAKEAILANEHDSEVESFIFYMDNRAVGKGFQDFILRAEREYKVQYVRAKPAKISVALETKNPIIHYEDTRDQKVKTMELDLVVLAQALIPTEQTQKMSEILNIKLDEFGFFEIPDKFLNPVDTTRSGVYAIGFCQAPMDIPEAVTQASGAAARAAETLAVGGA